MNIEINNYAPFTKQGSTINLNLNPLTIITGENGVGKRRLITAIYRVLGDFGYTCNYVSYTYNDYCDVIVRMFNQYRQDKINIIVPQYNDCTHTYNMIFQLEENSITVEEALGKWLNYFGIGEISLVDMDYYKQMYIGGIDIWNLGNGIISIIYFLICGMVYTKFSKSLVIFYNPENYLYPTFQCQIADFFLALSTTHKNIIIKTNSDHIINRVVKRIMEMYSNKSNPNIDNIYSLYYLTKNSSVGDPNYFVNIDEIKIHPHLGIEEFANGFFDSYAKEVEDIISTGYKNMMLDNNC